MGMQLQKEFGPHFHKKRERGDSIIELRVWLCTEKLLLHVSPRGLSILGLLLRALLKGGRKRLVLLKKNNVFNFFALHLINVGQLQTPQKWTQSCSRGSLKIDIIHKELQNQTHVRSMQPTGPGRFGLSWILELSIEILLSSH